MPGGGWQITRFDRIIYTNDAAKLSFPFNRAVIERNGAKQIVYYWFVQRGRTIANEYLSKWYLLADAIVENRTDGALVRLTTPLYSSEVEQSADQRLRSFIQELQPRLGGYLPSRLVTAH
jgi:EpsI family protein